MQCVFRLIHCLLQVKQAEKKPKVMDHLIFSPLEFRQPEAHDLMADPPRVMLASLPGRMFADVRSLTTALSSPDADPRIDPLTQAAHPLTARPPREFAYSPLRRTHTPPGSSADRAPQRSAPARLPGQRPSQSVAPRQLRWCPSSVAPSHLPPLSPSSAGVAHHL